MQLVGSIELEVISHSLHDMYTTTCQSKHLPSHDASESYEIKGGGRWESALFHLGSLLVVPCQFCGCSDIPLPPSYSQTDLPTPGAVFGFSCLLVEGQLFRPLMLCVSLCRVGHTWVRIYVYIPTAK